MLTSQGSQDRLQDCNGIEIVQDRDRTCRIVRLWIPPILPFSFLILKSKRLHFGWYILKFFCFLSLGPKWSIPSPKFPILKSPNLNYEAISYEIFMFDLCGLLV